MFLVHRLQWLHRLQYVTKLCRRLHCDSLLLWKRLSFAVMLVCDNPKISLHDIRIFNSLKSTSPQRKSVAAGLSRVRKTYIMMSESRSCDDCDCFRKHACTYAYMNLCTHSHAHSERSSSHVLRTQPHAAECNVPHIKSRSCVRSAAFSANQKNLGALKRVRKWKWNILYREIT